MDSTWDRLLRSRRSFRHRAGGLWFRQRNWKRRSGGQQWSREGWWDERERRNDWNWWLGDGYRVEGDSGLPLAVKQLR
jgi:hypothetical protein